MKLTIKNISRILLVAIIALAILVPVVMLSNTNSDLALDNGAYLTSEKVDVQLAGTESTEEQAEVQQKDDAVGTKAIAAAVVVGIAAAAGAIGMALAIGKAVHGIARQPEADNKIRTTLMLGLVFIETAIIYALIVAILIIFVM